MTDQFTLAHCHELIVRCELEFAWSLDPATRARYVEALMPLLVDLPGTRRPGVASNYHADHQTVAALRDPRNPAHDATWTRWCAQVIGVLRRSGRGWSQDSMLDTDDLAQVSRLALVEALPTFRYQSRLSTWAFSVIDRSARDHLRGRQALRRSGPTTSLDMLAEAPFLEALGESLDQTVAARLLVERIVSLLKSLPDRRLAQIFHLWAIEDRSTAEIGNLINLHESRVRALLQQARAYLRQHQELQRWLEREG